MASSISNVRPEFDPLLRQIADYAAGSAVGGELAFDTARHCLMDALGCALLALEYPACVKLLGPVVPGAFLEGGVRVPGTSFRLDPVQGAFNLGAMIRWLDYNDTWLAQEWGHPSDNFGAILAAADYRARSTFRGGRRDMRMREVLAAGIKAYEIQGVLALNHAFNRAGLDHVVLVKVASTAVSAALLGGTREEILNAVSNAWVDGQSLRTYRHAPNTGSRKSWAAGDAAARGMRLALMALAGEMGYPSALTAPTWGFQDASFRGKPVALDRPLGAYVMENVLFKVSFPAEFHAQTAVEAAIALHPKVKGRLEEIQEVVLSTQESACRIIDKSGPLHNPADRDHCLQYMVAIGLLFGTLEAGHYEDEAAADPRIDALRAKMKVAEDPRYTRDYLDPDKRSIANAVQVRFRDGTATDKAEVEYPLGHRRRRAEALPRLEAKFRDNAGKRFSPDRVRALEGLFADRKRFEETLVSDFMALWGPEAR